MAKTMNNDECICEGNWRNLVNEYEPLFNRKFKNVYDDKVYILLGLTHGPDDFYYLMWNEDDGMHLATCVGALTSVAYVLLDEEEDDE